MSKTVYRLWCVMCHAEFVGTADDACPNGHTAQQQTRWVQEGHWE